MARKKSGSKGNVSRDNVEERLRNHFKKNATQKIAELFAGVSVQDSHFNHRTWNLMNWAEAMKTTITHLFDDRNFRVVDYFEGLPEEERPECELCYSERLSKGYSVEIGNSVENKTQHSVGPTCLERAVDGFASNSSNVREAVEKRKKEVLAGKHGEVMTELQEVFGKKITLDDLSLVLMKKLVSLRQRHSMKARQFQDYMDGVLKDQAQLREEFRQEYAEQLQETVQYLNGLPVGELINAIPSEIERSEGKGPVMKKLLGSDSISDADKQIIRDMFNTRMKITPEQYERIGLVFRMYFPRKLHATFGSVLKDLRRRHEEGAISDEVYTGIKRLVEGRGKINATGEECMRLRWADPEDILMVREAHNNRILIGLKEKYNVDPVTALRKRIMDHYDSDSQIRAEKKGRPKQADVALLHSDYKLVDRLMRLTGSIATADIRSNPKNFRRIVTQALAMDDFDEMAEDLSVLARKNLYSMRKARGYKGIVKRQMIDRVLKTAYISTERFLDAAGFDEKTIGHYAGRLGIGVEDKSREQLSVEIAEAVVTRVRNTYVHDEKHLSWLAGNREDLKAALTSKYRLIDRKQIKPLLEKFEEIEGATELDDATKKALREGINSGVIDVIPGIRKTVTAALSEMEYEVK